METLAPHETGGTGRAAGLGHSEARVSGPVPEQETLTVLAQQGQLPDMGRAIRQSKGKSW